ncbi:MAG: hypothetical protein HRU36_05595 [Rickettsiales bacterium]|nr:hypothetical protein [Rickettsiales bacterium]
MTPKKEWTIAKFNLKIQTWLKTHNNSIDTLLDAPCYNIDKDICIERTSPEGNYIQKIISDAISKKHQTPNYRDSSLNIIRSSEEFTETYTSWHYSFAKMFGTTLLVGASFTIGGALLGMGISTLLCVGDYYYFNDISACVAATLTTGTLFYCNEIKVVKLLNSNNKLLQASNDLLQHFEQKKSYFITLRKQSESIAQRLPLEAKFLSGKFSKAKRVLKLVNKLTGTDSNEHITEKTVSVSYDADFGCNSNTPSSYSGSEHDYTPYGEEVHLVEQTPYYSTYEWGHHTDQNI